MIFDNRMNLSDAKKLASKAKSNMKESDRNPFIQAAILLNDELERIAANEIHSEVRAS